MVSRIGRVILLGAAVAAGCATAPKTQEKRTQLQNQAEQAKATMLMKDPSVGALLDQSAGYIVFPEVREGGFIAGGAGAKGVVYQYGRPVGFANLSRVSFGAQIGGQTYAEFVIIRDPDTLEKMKTGDLDVGGQASAVIIRAGAASAANFSERGVAVVIDPIGGAMVNLSVAGQRIRTTTKL
jgi:lipid-binding SYLF domain-containing protein